MKKLLIIVSLMLVMSTLVSCAGQTVPTASEITNVVPSAATSETTETSEPASTTSQPVVTPPYIVSEPAMISDGAPFSNQIIETEDKIFPAARDYTAVSYGNLYEYYSKIDGKMHVFCDDPNCDHKNFDGEKFTPKCAACLICDPYIPFEVSPLIYFRERIYFVNFGEIFSSNEDGGDVRLEYSISDKREPYEILAADPSRTVVSSGNASLKLNISSQDGQYIYLNAVYGNENQPTFRYDILTKKLINLNEKIAALEEKLGTHLAVLSTKANGKIYVWKYVENTNPDEWYLGDRIYEDGTYEITADFEDIVLSSDSFDTTYYLRTTEGRFIRGTSGEYDNKLVLIKENGEVETIIDNIKETLGDDVRFLYIDTNYIYYTFLTGVNNSLNLGKVLKIPNTRLNSSWGKILRYDRNAGKNTDVVEVVKNHTKKSGTKTELKDENGQVYGYYDLYDITIGTNPYYFTKLNDSGKVEKSLYYESEKTLKDVRGYYYYKVDTSKTAITPIIDQSTMEQVIDDGVSYNDTSTYFIDHSSKLVYLVVKGPVVYNKAATTTQKPTFDNYKTTVDENDIRRPNTAVLDNIMIDQPGILYIDEENGKVLLSAEVLFVMTSKNQMGQDVMNFANRYTIATCDIDGAGNFVNITPVVNDIDYNDELKETFEQYGYSLGSNRAVETKYAVYSFEFAEMLRYEYFSYYFKPDGKFRALCTDPNCNHTVFDGKEVKTTCPAAMICDPHAKYTGTDDVTPVFINSRFYFVFFQEIYSCDEFGGDLRLEVSLDKDRGEYDILYNFDGPATCEVPKIRINNFMANGDTLYFMYKTESGAIRFYKFDIFSKELVDLTPDVEAVQILIGRQIELYCARDGKVYFEVKGSPHKFYYTTDDFKTFEETGALMKTPVFDTDDGAIMYETVGDKTNVVLIKPNGEKDVIVDNIIEKTGRQANMVYISDEYFYYYKRENVSIGKNFNLSKDDTVSVSGGKLIRYNIKTGEKTVVINDPAYDYFEILFIDDEKDVVLLQMDVFTSNGSRIVKTNDYYTCRINSKGEFVKFRKVPFYS